MDADSCIVYIKTDAIYKDIVANIQIQVKVSKYYFVFISLIFIFHMVL